MQPRQAVRGEPRLVRAAGGRLLLHPLPVADFPNGHVAFVQRSPWAGGAVPFAIHATFQRYNLEGKRARFRRVLSVLPQPPCAPSLLPPLHLSLPSPDVPL